MSIAAGAVIRSTTSRNPIAISPFRPRFSRDPIAVFRDPIAIVGSRLRSPASRLHGSRRRLTRSHRWGRRRRRRLELGGIRYRGWSLRSLPFLREVGDLVFLLHAGLRSGRALCDSPRGLPPKVSKRAQAHQERALEWGIAIACPTRDFEATGIRRAGLPTSPPTRSASIARQHRRYWRRLSFSRPLVPHSSSAIARLPVESSP